MPTIQDLCVRSLYIGYTEEHAALAQELAHLCEEQGITYLLRAPTTTYEAEPVHQEIYRAQGAILVLPVTPLASPQLHQLATMTNRANGHASFPSVAAFTAINPYLHLSGAITCLIRPDLAAVHMFTAWHERLLACFHTLRAVMREPQETEVLRVWQTFTSLQYITTEQRPTFRREALDTLRSLEQQVPDYIDIALHNLLSAVERKDDARIAEYERRRATFADSLPQYWSYATMLAIYHDDWDQLQRVYQEAIGYASQSTQYLWWPAIQYDVQNRYDEIYAQCEQILRIDPLNEDAWLHLGNYWYFGQHQMGKAIECYQQAIAYDAHYSEAHHNLAMIYEELSNTEQAKLHFWRAVELAPDTFNPLRSLLICSGDETPEEILPYCLQALPLLGHHSELWLRTAMLLNTLERYDQMLIIVRQGLERFPEDNDLLFQYAFALSSQGDKEGAITHYLRLAERDPTAIVINNLAGIYAYIDQYKDEAEYWYRRGLDAYPRNRDLRSNYAIFLRDWRRDAEADAQEEILQQLPPDDAQMET